MTQVPPPPTQPGPPTPQAVASQPPRPVKGPGLAIAALVVGILSFIPCVGWACALVAIVLAIVSLATNRRGTGVAVAGIALSLALVSVSIAIFMPTLAPSVELRRRATCGANLNMIGKSMHIYLAEHEQSPADIDVLMRQGLSPKALRCPSAKKGRKSDYFFHFPAAVPVGKAIVGCDLKGNHRDGRNVLTYQGSVRWIKGEAAFQAELALPHNAAFARELRKVEGPATPAWE